MAKTAPYVRTLLACLVYGALESMSALHTWCTEGGGPIEWVCARNANLTGAVATYVRAGQGRPAQPSRAPHSDFPAGISAQIQLSTARLLSISGEASSLLLSAYAPLKYVPRIRLEKIAANALPLPPANSPTASSPPPLMSSHVHIPVLVTSRPPSREDLDLERRCPASASDSGSESADSPPPDSPQDRGRAALPPLDLKLANRQHVAGPYSSSTSSYSPSPTSSESAHQSAYDRPIQPLVQTVPVIPTLLPMPSLATEPSLSPTLSDAGTTKARSGEEHRCLSTQTEGQVGPSRTRSKHSSATIGLASTLDQTAPYNSSHPYARIYTRKEGAKRRKMWNHAFEKSLFTPQEM